VSERIALVTVLVTVRDLTKEELELNGEGADELVPIGEVPAYDVAEALKVAEENDEAFAGSGNAISIVSLHCVSAEWKT
jgi:hypothetical protein